MQQRVVLIHTRTKNPTVGSAFFELHCRQRLPAGHRTRRSSLGALLQAVCVTLLSHSAVPTAGRTPTHTNGQRAQQSTRCSHHSLRRTQSSGPNPAPPRPPSGRPRGYGPLLRAALRPPRPALPGPRDELGAARLSRPIRTARPHGRSGSASPGPRSASPRRHRERRSPPGPSGSPGRRGAPPFAARLPTPPASARQPLPPLPRAFPLPLSPPTPLPVPR